MRFAPLGLLFLLLACQSQAPAGVEPIPAPGPASPAEPAPPAEPVPVPEVPATPVPEVPSTANRGESCTAPVQCAAGLTCVQYFGIAGPSGPRFGSCETSCVDSAPCPDGLKCITIADGPGAVCRSQ